MAIRILVVDDYESWRNRSRMLLQARPEWRVICEVSDGFEAVQKADELRPDVILLDIGLPKLNGIEAARQIHHLSPNSKLVFVSMENSQDIVQVAMSAGGQGYVFKASAQSDLLPAIDAVLRGEQFVSRTLRGDKLTDIPEQKTPQSHDLLLFSDEVVLLDSFARFIFAALVAGNAAIVLVTKQHQESLRQRLKAESVDIDGAIQQGTLILLDVANTLAQLIGCGLPDPFRFYEDFSALIDAASKAAEAEHPRVAFCGECLGRLWAEGRTDLAIQLEQTCNDLAKKYRLDMLCAYPLSSVHGEENEHIFQSIRAEHTAVYS